MIQWARYALGGYEVSSKGDKRFSAFNALMPDGRSIEHWYQCDVKGYDPGGRNWRWGKGKAPLVPYPEGELWLAYLGLWRLWAVRNSELLHELDLLLPHEGAVLTDCFATSEINQARALATILNQWVRNQ
jgi:hypothetical protein